MSVVPEIGKCYYLTGKKTAWGYPDEVKPPQYLGKYIGSEEQGSHDRFTILKFQYDNNRVPGDQFTVTMCREEPDDAEIKRRAEEAENAAIAAKFGHGRRRRKTRTRKHKRVSRKTRRYRK